MPNTLESLRHLSDQEIIGLLLGQRKPRCQDVRTAYQVEALQALAGYGLCDLQQALQLSSAATERLGAALELHRRLLQPIPQRPALRTSDQAAQLMRPFALRDHECLWCLCLDTHSRLIGEPLQVSQGDIDGCDAGPRLFFRNALRRASATAIAVHNHPSGNPQPSPADVAVTRRLISAGKAVDIALVDHLIISPSGEHQSLRRSHPELWA